MAELGAIDFVRQNHLSCTYVNNEPIRLHACLWLFNWNDLHVEHSISDFDSVYECHISIVLFCEVMWKHQEKQNELPHISIWVCACSMLQKKITPNGRILAAGKLIWMKSLARFTFIFWSFFSGREKKCRG